MSEDVEALLARVRKLEAERDKWLEAFNRSEQFQDGPTKRAEQAEAEVRALAQERDEVLAAVKEFVVWHGAAHTEECPADDTCDCIGGAINARVDAAIGTLEARDAARPPETPEEGR